MSYLGAISQISDVQSGSDIKGKTTNGAGADLLSILKDSIKKVKQGQEKVEVVSASVSTKSVRDLHQVAIAIDKAEINMKMILELRNKALSAYKDILRTQV
jgi:flagellar hook-basal body complex protein FliE